MTNELYQMLDNLVNENKELTLNLHLANAEIANLKIEVERLENGQLRLIVKLEDSENEVGRLSMVLKHRYDDSTTLRQLNKG